MSLFETKAVCENVKFYSHHIDPQLPNVSGNLSLADGHTSNSAAPDQTYSLTNISSSDPSSNNHLHLTGQAGGPAPSVVAMDAAPNGTVNFPVALLVQGQPVGGGIAQNLEEVLAVGNFAGSHDIDAHGSNVICNTMKSNAIQAAGAPLINAIAVESNLGMVPFTQLQYSQDAKISCNAAGASKTVLETQNASASTTYKLAEGNIKYESASKKLTINPISSPPAPLLPTQGLTVVGNITATNGGMAASGSIASGAEITATEVLVSKGGSQPRVEFQDGAGYAHGQVGWSAAQTEPCWREPM